MKKNETDWYLEKAFNEAQKAEIKGEVPIGAVIVRNSKIIARAHNLKELKKNAIMHAEIIAVQKASKKLKDWRLTDCILYVTLEPCLMCLAALQNARIKKVFYGAKDLKGGAISCGYEFHKNLKLNHRFEVEYIENKKCSLILSTFFKKIRINKKK